jgi:thymidine phosphorylase
MLLASKLAHDLADAEAKAEAALASGAAAEVFARMVVALGGPADLFEKQAQYLPLPALTVDIPAPRAGIVTAIDTREIGLAVVAIGGGRTRSADPVDPLVGLTEIVGLGASVGPGQPLARLHVRDAAQAARATAMVQAAFTLGDVAPVSGPIVAERLG